MNKEVTGNREFLDEILTAARAEAEMIAADAEKKAQARIQTARRQEEFLLAEADKLLEAERTRQEKRADQKISSEKRRRELQLRDRFMSDAIEKTRETMIAMTQTDAYGAVLADWVVEAVLGLGVKEVFLNGRVREKEIMTDAWLREREKTLKESYGRESVLELSDEPAMIQAGVVAGEKGGRLVFNNQIDTRILRKQSDLRKAIYGELFDE